MRIFGSAQPHSSRPQQVSLLCTNTHSEAQTPHARQPASQPRERPVSRGIAARSLAGSWAGGAAQIGAP